ncbi:MAG: SoxR reducing system RseC family protein [Pseudomonadales bacterium]|nr:SoxR reducing system RseC family protein [Pseudomonadales bacterium]
MSGFLPVSDTGENMLVESGRVVSVEDTALWVETFQKSTCSSCAAKDGCGQKALSILAPKAHYIRVLLEPDNQKLYQRGDIVQLAIPANTIMRGALLVYLFPLVVLVVVAMIARSIGLPEAAIVACGLTGLLCSGAVIAWHNRTQQNNPDYQPRIVHDSGQICVEIVD